jgi:hypothetical protein
MLELRLDRRLERSLALEVEVGCDEAVGVLFPAPAAKDGIGEGAAPWRGRVDEMLVSALDKGEV